WGTAETAAGAALTCLLYAAIDPGNAKPYIELARSQRDFILGCNPFGICCLVGGGARFPLFPHHQVADLLKRQLSGALVGGPADVRTLMSQRIRLAGAETCPSPLPGGKQQISTYQDAVFDYVTNEPAIDYTSTFLLLMAYYQNHTELKENKQHDD
ncbi:MAG TPA: glycoside hydrolase family 9 protein, partial [Chthonomonadales bacterium]|nr:glycoside hydrolase family 9 protein [Chthonomonadales bacterium]